MKRNLILFGAVTAIFALTLTSCKKDKKKGCTSPTATNYDSSAEEDDGSCTEPTPTAAQPSGYTPTFTGSLGVLVGLKTVSTVTQLGFTYDVVIGTAVAMLTDDGGSTFKDAGNVTVDSYSLTKQSNGTYAFIPSQTSTTGIDFTTDYTWNGSGNSWPTFNIYMGRGFADITDITSGNVNLASDYVVSSNTISGADSIYFAVHGPNGSKSVMVGGDLGMTSQTFTASQLSGLGKGKGYAQIVGINYKNYNTGGKDYILLNETVRTKMVDFN